MSYITKANALKIITKSINENSKKLSGNIYEPMKIYFFSKYEKQYLLAFKTLLENPEKYFTEVYKKIESIDTFRYVYEGNKPCYHNDTDCDLLYSNMTNYLIPDDIKDRGEKEVEKFRKWFKTVQHHIESGNEYRFVERLRSRWGIVTNVNAIRANNSGIEYLENIDIEDLKTRINNKIKEAGRYYYASKKNTEILHKFSKISFIANKKSIYGNNTQYTDDDVKEFLKRYNENYKEPIKKDLIQYYKLEYNPDIKMEGKFLQQIGFKPCSRCHKAIYIREVLENSSPNFHALMSSSE